MAYRNMAMLMIFLVITLPIYASEVLASSGSLSSPSYSGDEGIQKVIAPTDHLNVIVMAAMKDNNGQSITVSPGYVRLSYDGHDFQSSSCVDTGSYNFQCAYQSDLMDWRDGKHSLEIKLYDQYFVQLSSISDAFYVDKAGPEISVFDSDTGANTDFNVTYSVKDVSCDGCGSLASGLAKIDFLVDGKTEKSIADFNDSTASGSITIPIQGMEQGSRQLCIIAYDRFDNSNKKCRNVYVDYTPPAFEHDSFSIEDKDGAAVDYTGFLPIDTVVSINISEDESELGTVVADLSALNTVAPEKYRWIKPSCQQEGSAYKCSWDVMIDGAVGQATIQINATDSAGNTDSFSKTISLQRDATAPVVTSIDSDNPAVDDIKYLRAENNTITMDIDEAGSGMDKMDAYLDLHYLSSQYNDVRAENCTDMGSYWLCSWPGVEVAGKPDGAELTVNVASVKDDVGNNYDTDGSETSETFVYDNKAPTFLNITITPVGTDMEILRETDVADIVAYLQEDGSGISADNVMADYSDFDSSGVYTPASSCEQVNDSIWRCEWEYSGTLNGGADVVLNIVAKDNAGNRKDSTADHVTGKIFVAGVTEKEVHFWDGAEAYDINKLNRNFLWMSSSGTYIRAGLRLVPDPGTSYVHGFEITSCQGALVIPGDEDVYGYQPYSIKDQKYYPGVERSDKYLLINIPSYDKSNLGNATAVRIICNGEVIQSSNERGDVYSPNEPVNATFDVELTNPIFESPGIAAVDKITQKQKQLDRINWWIKSIDFWVDMLRPFCSLFNMVRQVLAGICTLWNGISYTFLGGQSNSCFLQFDLLDRLWYGEGKRNPDTGQWIVKGGGTWVSSKGFVSVGFWCDLVLCEDCANIWKQDIFGDLLGVNINSLTDKLVYSGMKSTQEQSTWWPGQTENDIARRTDSYMPAMSFDPQKSLIVSVLCFPPCLTGILNKLQAYKQILITYNVCMNTAAVRGTDTSECDDYYSSQVCQQVIGEFWYLVDDFIKDYITKAAMWAIEEKGLREHFCNDATKSSTALQQKCIVDRVYRIAGWFLQLSETINNIKAIKDNEWFKKDDKQSEKDAQDKVDSELGNNGG